MSEVRKVEAFSSIRITSVGTVYFTQSDSYSLQIEGREKYVKNTESTVKDGHLTIGFKNKKMRNQNDGVTIRLSAPDLEMVEFIGVGEFNCEEPLKLDKLEGGGVGEITLSGTAGHADISKGGIGGVNTGNLKIGR